MKNKIIVYSPDDIPIQNEPFKDIKEAKKYIKLWIKRYEIQGYYSSVKYGRIPIERLKNCLEIVIYNDKGTHENH